MNIFRRIYNKATGVLGYDCQGEPLRRGDLVEPAPCVRDDRIAPFAKCQMVLYRKAFRGERLRQGGEKAVAVLLNPDRKLVFTNSWAGMRKVPQWEQQARWENVERLTGWSPQVVKEGEVKA